jgi:hypothetical protein
VTQSIHESFARTESKDALELRILQIRRTKKKKMILLVLTLALAANNNCPEYKDCDITCFGSQVDVDCGISYLVHFSRFSRPYLAHSAQNENATFTADFSMCYPAQVSIVLTFNTFTFKAKESGNFTVPIPGAHR